MSNKIDFSIATSEQIRLALCARLQNIRLARNITQNQLAKGSGVSLRTIKKMEDGQGISLDTFIRVLIALNLQSNLKALLPDPSVRPIERVNTHGTERKRARPVQSIHEDAPWAWGDESMDKK
jgi:putative transcriptional regulator